MQVVACCDYLKATTADENPGPVPVGAFEIRPDGRAPHLINRAFAEDISYSADGRLIAGGRPLDVGHAPDGTGARAVTGDLYDWSPVAHRLIATLCCTTEGQQSLTVVGSPSWRPRALGTPALDTWGVWSPKGDFIAATAGEPDLENERLSTVRPDGTARRAVARGRIVGNAWDPAGRRLAFATTRPGCTFSLHTADRDGRHARRLARVKGRLAMDRIAWLTGGTIVFVNEPCGVGPPTLMTISSRNGRLRKLARLTSPYPFTDDLLGVDEVFVPSPQLDRLAFVSKKSGAHLMLFDSRSGRTIRLATYARPSTAAGAHEPVWSPDGRQLVYTYEPGCQVRAAAARERGSRELGTFSRIRNRLKGPLESVECAYPVSWQPLPH